MGPEAKIQKAVVDYARAKYDGKIIVLKRQAGRFGTNGYPDYEFLIPKSTVFHIEFKAPGGKCTPIQLQRHAELRAIGHRVYVVEDAFLGKKFVDDEMIGFSKAVAAANARRKAFRHTTLEVHGARPSAVRGRP